ncbi:MAG: deoxyribose-phosphate aldolase, partial [Deferribacterales bacterium]
MINPTFCIIEKIDITYLKGDLTKDKLKHYIDTFKKYNFASLCIPIAYLNDIKEFNIDKDKKITTVIGFPFGYDNIDFKVFQLEKANFYGCDEYDFVFNISKFLDKDYKYIYNELKTARKLTFNKTLKIIVETCYLSKTEILDAVNIIIDTGCDYVKTSTGFAHAGAKIEDILLIKDKFRDKIKIKASGGIKDIKTAIAMIDAGADRLGISDVSF